MKLITSGGKIKKKRKEKEKTTPPKTNHKLKSRIRKPDNKPNPTQTKIP